MSSHRTTYYNDSTAYLQPYSPQEEAADEDFKMSYDEDIISNYASPELSFPDAAQRRSQHIADHHYDMHPSYTPYPPSEQIPHLYNGRNLYSEYGLPPKGVEGGKGSNGQTDSEVSHGFWAKFLPDSMACRFYVLTVLVETIIDIAIVSDLFLRFRTSTGDNADNADSASRRLPVYLAIFAFAHIFQLLVAIDAVYARNTLQFFFLTIFNLIFLGYAIDLIFEIRNSVVPDSSGISSIPVNILTAIIPIIISVAELAYIALGWKIWSEFGWKVYKLLGADRRVKRMFAHYQIFECLVKFDIFFFIGFSVQLIWLVLNPDNWEWYVTCAALPLSFLLLVVGHIAARNESRPLMVIFMIGCGGAMVYFVYKLYRVVSTKDELSVTSLITFGVFIHMYFFAYKFKTSLAIIAIVFLVATFVWACIVMRNFNAGLKYHMSKSKKLEGGSLRGVGDQQRQSKHINSNSNRMSIE